MRSVFMSCRTVIIATVCRYTQSPLNVKMPQASHDAAHKSFLPIA
jgi:hypothetical protein